MAPPATGRRPSGPAGYAKSRDTRAQILAAALAEAGERGIHNASVAGIAARARTAVGSVHYHFGSRRELLRELMDTLMADLAVRLVNAEAEGGDFFSRHRADLLAFLRYVRANPTHFRVADEIRFHEPAVHQRAVAGWVEQMASRIRAGIAEGSLRPMTETEIRVRAHVLVGASDFLGEMLEQPDAPDEEAVVDAYLSLVRDGLGGTDHRGRAGREP